MPMLSATKGNKISIKPQRVFFLFRALWPVFVMVCFNGANLIAEEVDHLLVAVNGSVITEGDLYIARYLNELVFPGQAVDSTSKEEEIDRLINQELIRQEMINLRMGLEDESVIDDRIQKLEKRYESSGGIARYLDSLGISREELYSFLKLRILTSKFLEFRFQPFVRVSEREIASYYTDILQPQLRESDIAIPPLKEVSDKIKEILKEKKLNAELDQWIENTRSNAEIEYFRDNGLAVPENADEPSNKPQAGSTE